MTYRKSRQNLGHSSIDMFLRQLRFHYQQPDLAKLFTSYPEVVKTYGGYPVMFSIDNDLKGLQMDIGQQVMSQGPIIVLESRDGRHHAQITN